MTGSRNPDGPFLRTITAGGELAGSHERSYRLRASWADETLMAAVVRGDALAFSVVYDRHASLVYANVLRILGNAEAARDTTQDIFVRLWRRPELFVAERGRFVGWLMSVSRHRAVDELRARGRRGRHSSVDDFEGVASRIVDADVGPEQKAELQEDRVAVRRALADLPREQRLALELAYFGGMTQQQIASELHEPLGTVKTRIRLGMQKLRKALGGER